LVASELPPHDSRKPAAAGLIRLFWRWVNF
jgi:hypothetical protein